MSLNDAVTVTITDLTDKGDGIGQLDGRTLYVSGALPGEQVQVRLHGVKPKYAQGELLAVLQPSPDRVANFCSHDECGGCQIGILDYAAQLRLKRQRVQQALAAAMRRLLDEPGLLVRMGAAGRDLACREFDAEVVAEKILVDMRVPRAAG